MEQTLQIVIRSKGIGYFDSSSGSKKEDLKVIGDNPSSLILFKDRDTQNKQNDLIDIIFFLDKKTGVIKIRKYLLTDYLVTLNGKCDLN